MEAMDTPKLAVRRIQIDGSASKITDTEMIRYDHRLVSQIVRGILTDGGGLVLAAGKEPIAIEGDVSSPSVLFDWTVLETAASVNREGGLIWPISAGTPIVVVISEKAESEIPEGRRALWKQLLASRMMR